jgi:hypothetical protein
MILDGSSPALQPLWALASFQFHLFTIGRTPYRTTGKIVVLYILKLNSVVLVRKRTIPTERPQPVGEVNANFSWQRVSRGQRNRSPRP